MAEDPKARTRVQRLLDKREVHIIRAGSILAATLVFFLLSKYLLHAEPRVSQIVMFAVIVCALAVLDQRFRLIDTSERGITADSEKQQSQKMEAIGRLAGGLAHDFNNLLAIISGYTDLLLESLGPSDVNRMKLGQIKQATNSAASLTRQLLMFSRQQVVQPRILDIN